MAEFITKCPQCSTDLQAQDEWIGMEVECPQCNAVFEIISPFAAIPDITQCGEHTVAETEKEGSFTFVCPSCGSVEELPYKLLGTAYECQSCFEKRTAAATTERDCPFCGKTVKNHAKICKHCKQDLSNVPSSTPLQEKLFIFICPECDTIAELPESMIGEKYECKSCCESSVATEAIERKCPYCGEMIKIKATICKHCKKKISQVCSAQNKTDYVSQIKNHASHYTENVKDFFYNTIKPFFIANMPLCLIASVLAIVISAVIATSYSVSNNNSVSNNEISVSVTVKKWFIGVGESWKYGCDYKLYANEKLIASRSSRDMSISFFNVSVPKGAVLRATMEAKNGFGGIELHEGPKTGKIKAQYSKQHIEIECW